MSKNKMEGKPLQERLCRKFCRYYKPSKDESLACMGYLVVESLLKDRNTLPLPSAVERQSASLEKMLVGLMCSRCPFFEDGCDFVKAVAGSSPCGGFVVLCHIVGTQELSFDDIERTVDLMKQMF